VVVGLFVEHEAEEGEEELVEVGQGTYKLRMRVTTPR
jgi:hypothetical protein